MIVTKHYSQILLLLFFSTFFCGSLFSSYFMGMLEVNNSYDLKRCLVIVFTILATVFLLCGKSVQIILPSRFTCFSVCTIFIFGTISALYGEHTYWSMVELANFLVIIYLFFIISVCVLAIGRDEVIRYFFWFSLFFSLCISLKFFLFMSFHFLDLNKPNIHSLVSGFMNVRFFNQLQVILMPLLCLAFFIDELKRLKRLAIFLFAFLWLILLQSEARGALLAVTASALIMVFFMPVSARQQFVRSICMALGIGFSLWLLLVILLPLFIFNDEVWQLRTSSSGRIAMWLYILQEIPQQILLGYGPMSFAWAEGKPIPNAHPHNSLLQFLYEYGLVIFIIVSSWSVLKLTGLLKGLKRCKQAGIIASADIVVVFALTSAWIYSMFDGMAVMPLSQALLAAVLGLNCQDNKSIQLPIRWRILVAVIVLLLGAQVLASLTRPELSEQMYPRLWLKGVVNN